MGKINRPALKIAPFIRTSTVFSKRDGYRARKFFQSRPWDQYWQEFLTARERNGRITYLTAYSCAKKKAQTDFEMDIIYRAIGPRITALKDHNGDKMPGREVPYLGDWQQLRARAYFYDNESVDKMRTVVTQKLDGLEAGRGAAIIILDLIAKWAKYDDKIDELFNYTPVEEGLSLAKQDTRQELFFRMKNNTMNAQLKLVDKYLKCHGISADGLNDLGQLVMSVSNAATKNALVGAATGAAIAGDPNSPALAMLSRAIFDKARIFSMPPPTAIAEELGFREPLSQEKVVENGQPEKKQD